MLRVQAGGVWYTVLFGKHGPYVYEDFSIPGYRSILPDNQQAQLRKVVCIAEKWAKENL